MLIRIAPDVRLYVDIEGLGLVPDGPLMREKPTLMLMHGGPGFDHSSFKPLFSQLADVAQIIYYDHRGHGRSDARPLSELTLDTHADDIVRLCDALGITKPIVLGQSFGGFVAQRYIARHPTHASKVILSSTAGNMTLDRKLAMFEKLGGKTARDVADKFWTMPNETNWKAYERVCYPLYNTTKPENDHRAKRAMLNTNILFNFVNGERKTLNLLPGLANAQCPVLVMAGEQDPVCPLEDAKDIFNALPQQWRQFASFANAGHGVWRDEEVKAIEVLCSFTHHHSRV
jgi:pimeloyl-ACP methyl ester carboxylesterase